MTFPHADGSRSIKDFSVGFSDGQMKVLTMIAIVCFVHELVTCLYEVCFSSAIF